MGYMEQTMPAIQVKPVSYPPSEVVVTTPTIDLAHKVQTAWVPLPLYGVEISACPVHWADYMRFAEISARPHPHCIAGPNAPLTHVSASDATAYAEWVSQHSSYTHRLPTEEELRELVSLTHDGKTSMAMGGFGTELQSLSEWLFESAGNGLHRIAHCSWLLSPGKVVCQAALNDHGYSFVTFRLVRI